MTCHASDRLDRIAARARAEQAVSPARRPIRPDPVAIADAIIAKGRLSRIIGRAAAPDPRKEWEAEMRHGESVLQAMERAIAEGMPTAITVLGPAPLSQIRREYEALSPEERRCELERHLWAGEAEGRTRTHFSDLLDAMGVGR